MRIVHLSTGDVSGGAARATYRLHTGLTRLGHDSRMLVAKKWSDDPTVEAVRPPRNLASRLTRRLQRARVASEHARYAATRPAGLEPFRDDRTEFGPAVLRQLPRDADVINLHWVAGLVDHASFFAGAPPGVPLVWRLADMNPCTGGCHYDEGCGRFADRCGACPQLGSRDEHDLSRRIWQRKHDALRRHGRLHLVATSHWIAEQARRSGLLRDFPVTVIPNGLDTADFAPRDKAFARDTLGVPRDARVVLFVAEALSVKRKGFALLLEALAGLHDVPGLLLLSVGSTAEAAVASPVPQVAVGRVNIDRHLSLAYSAADVFVIPSVQESFGQTVSESLACGTPVVGFATGGMLDMVRPGITGQLVPVGDTAALRGAIDRLLREPESLRRMSAQCRAIAVREYSMETQADAYVKLYESLVAAERVSPA